MSSTTQPSEPERIPAIARDSSTAIDEAWQRTRWRRHVRHSDSNAASAYTISPRQRRHHVYRGRGEPAGFAATPGLYRGGPRPGPPARLASGGYLAAACAIMVVLFAPDLIWQWVHGLPNIGVFRHLQQGARRLRLVYWPAQVFYTSIVLAPLWVRGLLRRHV